MDFNEFPNVAACDGAWTIPGIHNPDACNNKAGNDAIDPGGNGCSTEDLCADGWHVCKGDEEFGIASNGEGCFLGDIGSVEEPRFYLARAQVDYDQWEMCMDSGPAGNLPMGSDGLLGCGNLGCFDAPNPCYYLEVMSPAGCMALGDPGCDCEDTGGGFIECYGSSQECQLGCQSLSWWSAYNGTEYETLWSCGSDLMDMYSSPAMTVVKDKPEQGGVLCCRSTDELKLPEDGPKEPAPPAN